MGPLATGDLAGLDVGWRIRKEFGTWKNPASGSPWRKIGCANWAAMVRRRRGMVQIRRESPRRARSGSGRSDAEVGRGSGHHAAARSPEEIVDRCIYALVNEGARILEEGFALRAVDIDIIYINGYGFPAYRGGPMWYADTVGLEKVYRGYWNSKSSTENSGRPRLC